MKITIKSVATALSTDDKPVSTAEANGWMKVAIAAKRAREIGKAPKTAARGRAASVFEVENDYAKASGLEGAEQTEPVS